MIISIIQGKTSMLLRKEAKTDNIPLALNEKASLHSFNAELWDCTH
jgi:hypothetical protein